MIQMKKKKILRVSDTEISVLHKSGVSPVPMATAPQQFWWQYVLGLHNATVCVK